MSKVKTVTHDLTHDAGKVKAGRRNWKNFVDDYGHLRPDTYNISSPCYSSNPDFFLRPIVDNHKKVNKRNNYKKWNKEKKHLFQI